jgi:hypothetical protein
MPFKLRNNGMLQLVKRRCHPSHNIWVLWLRATEP